MIRRCAVLALAAVCPIVAQAAQSRELTFEERVEAQAALERVSYSHQLGATRSFEEAVPRPIIEARVERYLKQSVALQKLWSTPVTEEMLRAEMERQARETRMPERLRELYAALGDDPFLVQECLARPAVVDRLARNFFHSDHRFHAAAREEAAGLHRELLRYGIGAFANDPRRTDVELEEVDPTQERERESRRDIELGPEEFARWRGRAPQRPGEIGPVREEGDALGVSVLIEERAGWARIATFTVPKRSWDAWWAETAPTLDAGAVKPAAGPGRLPTLESVSSCLDDDTWDNGSLDDPRHDHTAVWTGSLMVVWGGLNGGALNSGGRYDPATDTWTETSLVGAPSPRTDHTAVWTGSLMVVWGGSFLDSGGRYDPVTDTWTATSLVDAPSPRIDHTAVWTGSRMVVWGGTNWASFFDSGGRYDPVTDTWTATSLVDAPPGRKSHTAVWTGSLMVVWGGYDGSVFDSGGRYNPALDTWTTTSLLDAPLARSTHTAVWTGSRMVVWGGHDHQPFGSGGRYDPATDTWMATSVVAAPSARTDHRAVWTGSRMVVWGGMGNGPFVNSGGRYDPATDTWTATSTVNVPSVRARHTAVWTGSQMVVWGGRDNLAGNSPLNSGGRYDPATDTWTATSMVAAPSGSYRHTAVWTGSLMVVWGGSGDGSGGRYDPATDTWTATSLVAAPAPRGGHTAVWTGSLMVVWGGWGPEEPLSSGGRYDPATDTWTATSVVAAPAPRGGHTAVWTGSLMVVWGAISNPGGRYNPATDTWTAIATTGSGPIRWDHTAVWTGSLMLVWGGSNGAALGSGRRYDPTMDTWTAMSSVNAPSPRASHTAVWTGSRMVVWGGTSVVHTSTGPSLDSGGCYDPATDTWTATSQVAAPSPRASHTAVWTGNRMVVWGGRQYPSVFVSGGRYDPATDTWTPTSVADAPPGRDLHSAVWTGSLMVVWGGSRIGNGLMNTGGRYALGQSEDDDGDGYSECAGDCNDGNTAFNPDATEICDGLDNDCDGTTPPVEFPPARIDGLGVSREALSWTGDPASADYDLVRGDLGTLRSTGGDFSQATSACVASVAATTVPFTEDPGPASGFWFLVRGNNGCVGAGSYDSDGPGQIAPRDSAIAASGTACP